MFRCMRTTLTIDDDVALQIIENQVRKIKIGKGKSSVFLDSVEIGNILLASLRKSTFTKKSAGSPLFGRSAGLT
jgi:hypothetical protein